MVAKDYPFYLTVKRANCSLEAPLGSGAAKDEVGRVLHTCTSLLLLRLPLCAARFLSVSPQVLRFSGSPLREFPLHAFSVGPLSLPLSLRPGTAAPRCCFPCPSVRQTEPQSLSRAGKDTYH